MLIEQADLRFHGFHLVDRALQVALGYRGHRRYNEGHDQNRERRADLHRISSFELCSDRKLCSPSASWLWEILQGTSRRWGRSHSSPVILMSGKRGGRTCCLGGLAGYLRRRIREDGPSTIPTKASAVRPNPPTAETATLRPRIRSQVVDAIGFIKVELHILQLHSSSMR